MSAPDILNFLQIDAHTATCGQPSATHFEALAGEHYESVINLAPADPARDDYFDEAALLAVSAWTICTFRSLGQNRTTATSPNSSVRWRLCGTRRFWSTA
ncbi:MAG: hypothetical protein ABWZ40_13885 [Caulobacterales bacterium]